MLDHDYEIEHKERDRYIYQWLTGSMNTDSLIYLIFLSRNPHYPQQIDYHLKLHKP